MPGRQRFVRTAENSIRVGAALLKHPTRSGQKLSSCLDLSARSFCRIMKDLSFYPYKIVSTQQLKPQDKPECLAFCHHVLKELSAGGMCLGDLVFTDEAMFHLNGS